MAYQFLDANSSIVSADSSVISGSTIRQAIDIASVLTIIPVTLTAPSVLTYTGSVVSGSVTAIFTSIVGLKNYLTDFVVANTGSVATLITFKDGSTSVLAYTVVPANSTTSATSFSVPLRTNTAQDLVYSISPATSVLYMTVQGYKSP